MKNNKKVNWKGKQDIANYLYVSAETDNIRLLGWAGIGSTQQKVTRQRQVRIPVKQATQKEDKP